MDLIHSKFKMSFLKLDATNHLDGIIQAVLDDTDEPMLDLLRQHFEAADKDDLQKELVKFYKQSKRRITSELFMIPLDVITTELAGVFENINDQLMAHYLATKHKVEVKK